MSDNSGSESGDGCGCLSFVFSLLLMYWLLPINFGSIEIPTEAMNKIESKVESVEGVKVTTSDTGIVIDMNGDTGVESAEKFEESSNDDNQFGGANNFDSNEF